MKNKNYCISAMDIEDCVCCAVASLKKKEFGCETENNQFPTDYTREESCVKPPQEKFRAKYKPCKPANSCTSKNETLAQMHYEIGSAHDSKGEIKLAIQSYNFCLECNPSHVQARYKLGHLVRKHMESSINVNLGNIKQAQGDLQGAMELYIEATNLNPGNVEAWTNLGLLYQYNNNLESSLQCNRTIISADPTNDTAYYNMACTLHDMGNIDEAIQMYKSATNLNRSHRDAFYNLGVAYHQSGRESDALQNYRQALAIDESFVEARNAIQLLSSVSAPASTLRSRTEIRRSQNNLRLSFATSGL